MRILAVLTKGDTVAGTMDAAVMAAASVTCSSIEALNVIVDPAHLVCPPEEIDMQELRTHDEGSLQQRADAIKSAFGEWNIVLRPEAPSIELRTITGPEAQTVLRETTADIALVVLSHNRNMDAADAFHAEIFTAHRPVLLVPPGWKAGARARFSHVAVGLTDSDLARRAIETAGPWLEAAERVSALRVTDESNADRTLNTVMQGSGVTPEVHILPRSDKTIGAQLVREADALKADVLVTGAFSHSEWLEWLMGHETREVLAAADLPLLLVH
ncbi:MULTISPECIES: universal stress protein [Rhizobiaceae]|nr:MULTISPECIES: universal stress protein [Rhizobiaceae]CAD6438328.1 universal stress protein [Rhizobium sp. Q54]AFR74903.1 hypothetical protein [Sinorhizobium sp. M14]KRA65191.1 hypothetical protein ASD85_25625 [Rhizobium sp. Root651]NTA84820.1 universal stress protein [Agrobacterium tumefaciens]RDL47716.1 hypothetical protein BLJAPNOD_05438 [Ensifer sp. M14]